ncbi:MAG: hypothetical protein GSR80_000660 [Desulfurococcales archaeon]|nr:hypothetical protein [Desulfurococcales archaeon]
MALGAPKEAVSEPKCVEGVLVIPRFTIRASTRREARRGLDAAPRGSLVVVEATAADAARYAAVNKLVDVLRLPPRLSYLVDRSTARLFRERGWGLVEISLGGLSADTAGRILPPLASALRRAEAYGVPVAVVSDAGDPLSLWHPYEVAGLAESLGIPWHRGLSWISTAPLSVLARRGWGRDRLLSCTRGSAGASSG